MNNVQFRDALERLDLTTERAATILKVHPRTAQRWVYGESKIPGAVALILEQMLREQDR